MINETDDITPGRNTRKVDAVTLEKIKVGMMLAISPYLMDGSVEIIDDYFYNHVNAAIKGFIWGETAAEKKWRYPSDWWQWFKRRWFPLWLKRRFPIQYTTRRMRARAVYPHFKPSLPNQEVRIFIEDFSLND